MAQNQQLISDLESMFNQGYYWTIKDITYYFRDADNPPSTYAWLGTGQSPNFISLPEVTRAYFREAVGYFEKIFDLNWTESTGQSGNLAIGAHDMLDGVGAYAYYPYANTSDLEIHDDNVWAGSTTNYPGKFVYGAIIHEMGHALGLPHPANGSPGGHATSMYYLTPYGHEQISFGMHDILVLQDKYGAVVDSTNDTYYIQSDSIGRSNVFDGNNIYLTGQFCLWDGGGSNTIDLSKNTLPSWLDMRPGEYSQIGDSDAFTTGYEYYNFSIAFNSIVTNAVGSSVEDDIFGNDLSNVISTGGGNDTIRGGAGNDTIDGGNGTDMATYAGARANFTVTKTDSGYTVTDNTSAEGTDYLSNIESILFADTQVILTATTDSSSTGGGSTDNNGSSTNDSSTDTTTNTDTGSSTMIESATSYALAPGEDSLLLIGSKPAKGIGNSDDNVITGNSGKNTLYGDAGNDTISGGLGKDVLMGGDGQDTFKFTHISQSSVDSIRDFTVGEDSIELDVDVFTNTTFVSVSNWKYADSGEGVIYETNTGKLYYDADGGGTGNRPVQIATLVGKPGLTDSDFSFG